MFECGLEDINLKAAKRSGFSGSTSSEDETKKHIDRILSQMAHQEPKSHRKVSQFCHFLPCGYYQSRTDKRPYPAWSQLKTE